MKPRLTAWLMATLLALTSTFASPVSRDAASCTSYGIVRMQKPRWSQRRLHQETPQRLEVSAFFNGPTELDVDGTDHHAPRHDLDISLVQRPPPVCTLSNA